MPKNPPLPGVPRPPNLQNHYRQTCSTASKPMSHLLDQLQQSIMSLPLSILIGTHEDYMSQFSVLPIVPSELTCDELWEEILDPTLNRFLGFGRDTDIKGLIRRGLNGMNGFYSWLETYLATGKIDEVLIEGKISRLIKALSELYVLLTVKQNLTFANALRVLKTIQDPCQLLNHKCQNCLVYLYHPIPMMTRLSKSLIPQTSKKKDI